MNTQINIIFVLVILTIHWFADFIMQDEKWALGKSKNWSDLLSHTLTYSAVWFFICHALIVTEYLSLLFYFFPIITFICHTITDYFTSRIVSKKFAQKQYGSSIPNIGAFTIIGFDQLLHFIQLLLTYQLLTSI